MGVPVEGGTGGAAVAPTPALKEAEYPVAHLRCSWPFRGALGAAIALGVSIWAVGRATTGDGWVVVALGLAGVAAVSGALGIWFGAKAGSIAAPNRVSRGLAVEIFTLVVIALIVVVLGALVGAVGSIWSERGFVASVGAGVLGGLRLVAIAAFAQLLLRAAWAVLVPRGRALQATWTWIVVPTEVERPAAIASLTLPSALLTAALTVDVRSVGVGIAAAALGAVALWAVAKAVPARRRHGPFRRFVRTTAETLAARAAADPDAPKPTISASA